MLKIQKTLDGLDTFYSTEYNQTYHSKHGVLQEARYVFLEGSDISQKIKSENKVSILEIGFGTGFNFFLTADLALKYKTGLTYYAVEKNLPDYKDYIKLNHKTHFSMNSAWLNFLSWRRHSSMLKNGVYKIVHRNINLYPFLSIPVRNLIRVPWQYSLAKG